MRSWAIYDRRGRFLFNISGDSADDAVSQAKKFDREAYKAVLVIERERY